MLSSICYRRGPGLLACSLLLLSACQPATHTPEASIPWLARQPLMPAPPAPPPPAWQQQRQEPPADTLVRLRNGFYFSLSFWADSTAFFRQLPPAPRLPARYADYQVYYARQPVGKDYDENYDRPLPRRFQLPGLQVEMYHHEYRLLNFRDGEVDGYMEPVQGCENHSYTLNAWRYRRQVLEFPQLRTAAGPLKVLNQALQTRYELEESVPEYPDYDNERAGQPILPFALTAAQLLRRPYYRETDSSLAADQPAMWRAPYRLLDTVATYQHFPNAACLVRLGPRQQLLGLTDYFDISSSYAERTSYEEDLANSTPAYYSLRLGRRAQFADLFTSALGQKLLRAVGPRLRHERRRYHLPPLDTTAEREQRQRLREPVYWEFKRRGLYAVYLTDWEEADYRNYQVGFSVLIPFYRLRDFLRP